MPQKEIKPSFLMLTPELVDRFYQAGFLTPKGAIYCSVASRKGVGEVYRHRPSDVYKRFGFNRSTYYRKLSELKVENWLNFTVHGYIHAWRPSAQPERVSDYSTVAELSQPCDSESQNCDTKSQPCDSESQNCDTKSQPCDKKSRKKRSRRASQAPSLYPDLDLLDLSLDPSEREKNRGIDPDFEEWLTKKSQELPTMPALLGRWIETQAKLQSNIKEFQKYKKQRQGASIPQAASAKFSQPEDEAANRLALLNHWWDDGYQERVKATIAAHPEWNLITTLSGVEVAR